MRILHALTHYDLLTGSGLYVYELARASSSRGHEVAVMAVNVGGELTARSRACGVAVHACDSPPPGPFDLLHLHQPEPGLASLERWPGVPAVATLHSPWPADAPIVSERIRTYACVRPDIRAKALRDHGVPRERTTVVLNGIDRVRFHPPTAPAPARDRPLVLFAATMSPARRGAAVDLLQRSVVEGFDVLFLGLGDGEYIAHLPANARWERRETWDIEAYVADADQVAGTFLGRTVIEGWMCGKPAWIYDMAPFGRMRSVALHPPPPPALLDLCDIVYMTDVFERIYDVAAG